ncbi:condensation domain-containing protein [Amycolatopsis sp. NPDC058340]|uniref:condensation domain-containing protein n=1 Tax=Amycolatopsis sp. NPDC058340 TaxID=3346453 RepID=UPI003649D76A
MTADLTAQGRELLLKRLAGGKNSESRSETPTRLRSSRIPLSAAQRRLWFIHELTQGGPAYNVPAAYRLRGALDVPALESAVALVVRRHEILRTTFRAENGEPYQVIGEPDVDVVVHDLSGADDPVAEAAGLATAAAGTRFRLADGPLLDVWLARLGAEDHVLGIVAHHILLDRESLEVLCAEISSAYRSFREGTEPKLPALAAQYADFAEWQCAQMGEAGFERHSDYWRETLRGVPPVLEVPADHPRPATPTHRAGEAEVRIPQGTAKALRALAVERKATLFMTCLAAFQGLLARYTAATSVTVGCPFNGRGRVAYEGVIGFFTNTLPIVAHVGGDPSGHALVDQAREAMLAAHAHQDFPFDRIVAEIDPPRDLGRNPLVQVWFDLASGQGAPAGGLGFPGVSTEFFGEGALRTRFDMELHLSEAPDGTVQGRLLYALDLFDGETAETFVEHYERFLAAFAAEPERRLSQVDFFSADQLHTLVERWGTGT